MEKRLSSMAEIWFYFTGCVIHNFTEQEELVRSFEKDQTKQSRLWRVIYILYFVCWDIFFFLYFYYF